MAQDWLELAKSLPAGHKVRVRCCSHDKSMIVSHTERGYSRHCFRCGNEGEIKFVPHGSGVYPTSEDTKPNCR